METRYIETYPTGRCIPVPLDTDINVHRDINLFDIHDIGHALALVCRFNGHCAYFYSVAEHSIRMSYSVPEELALVALMHDATEAYMSDIISPVKPSIQGYKEMENILWSRIASVFKLPEVLPPEIKVVDRAMCGFEARHLVTSRGERWGEGYHEEIDTSRYPCWINKECVDGWQHAHAKIRFMQRFKELTD